MESQLINAVIVEDEYRSIQTLKKLLGICCEHVRIVGTAQTLTDAIPAIESLKPDLVFLDIALPDGNGFEIFNELKYRSFEVIFVTAYNTYAIQAFEYSALHYILKPINPITLKKAVARYNKGDTLRNISNKIFKLNESLKGVNKKILLPTTEGFHVVEIKDIIYCEADRNYTTFFLTENVKQIVSKSMGYYQSILDDSLFVRVHNKYLVNMEYIKTYIKGQGGSIILKDGTELNVSRSRKCELIEKLSNYSAGE